MRVTTDVTDDTVGFDGLRAVVGAGDGVVGRFPGIVCVAHCSDPEPLRALLAVCADVAGREPGRTLARRLATWMSGPDAPGPQLRFGTIAAAGDQLAVYLVGDVDARVDAAGGLALSGAHAAIGTDRLMPRPASAIVLSLNGGEVRADPADVHDLRAGVVPGAGVVLRPAGFGLDDHADDERSAGHEWFDTSEETSDPFAGPPRASGVPAQRAAGTEVGGRNGAARAADPEATAEDDEPPAMAGGGSTNGWDGAPTDEPPLGTDDDLDGWLDPAPVAGPEHEPSAAWIDRPDPGVSPFEWLDHEAEPITGSDGWGVADPGNGTPGGRHALEAPAAPVEEWATPDTLADPPADTACDPLPSDAPADEPLRAPAFADSPAEAGAPTGRDALNGAPPEAGAGLVGTSSADALPVRPRSATTRAWPAEPASTPTSAPASTPTSAPTSTPTSAQSSAPTAAPTAAPTSAQPPTASLFAPAREAAPAPAPGSAVDPLAGSVALDGFAAPPEGAPGPTRPPPIPSLTPEPHTPLPRAAALPGHEAAPDVAERTAAPVDPEAEEAPGRRRGPRIRGYRCENGHLNDPRSPSCRECAAPIDERVGGLVAGPRPALGTLVFDDGAAHLVDGGYLVGRMPNVDERVRTGELRPIVVDDQTGSVSPAHAEIRVSGWDVLVIDNGSGNGTDVSGPDEGQWTALPPRRSRRLLPGTRVRLGARVFVFESSSTVR